MNTADWLRAFVAVRERFQNRLTKAPKKDRAELQRKINKLAADLPKMFGQDFASKVQTLTLKEIRAGQVTPPSAAPTPSAAARTANMPAEANMSEAQRRQVQEALHRRNYYQGPIDGVIGPMTRAAIRLFQHDTGAEATGLLTAEEANRLVATD